jgi:hypothetical protein
MKYWWLAFAALIVGAVLGLVWPAAADPVRLLLQR